MDIQRNALTVPPSSLSDHTQGELLGNDIDGTALAAHPGKSQRGE